MATLSIRPRRSKANPFPRSQGPIATWKRETSKGTERMALRANGTVVIRHTFDLTYKVAKLVLGAPPYEVDDIQRMIEAKGLTWERTS